MAGGVSFALLLLVGNLVNSFMEEGLFRGVMLRHFRLRLGFWRSNTLQAGLFAVWHMVWPIRHLMTGEADLAGAAGEAGTILIGTVISGLVHGYLYLKTDSLWAPWLLHFINNSVMNVLHVRTAEGLDTNIFVLYAVIAVGYLAIIVFAKALTRWLRMPELLPWGTMGRAGLSEPANNPAQS